MFFFLFVNFPVDILSARLFISSKALAKLTSIIEATGFVEVAEKRIVSAVAYFAGIFLNLRAWLKLLKKSGNCFSQKLLSDLRKKKTGSSNLLFLLTNN